MGKQKKGMRNDLIEIYWKLLREIECNRISMKNSESFRRYWYLSDEIGSFEMNGSQLGPIERNQIAVGEISSKD